MSREERKIQQELKIFANLESTKKKGVPSLDSPSRDTKPKPRCSYFYSFLPAISSFVTRILTFFDYKPLEEEISE